MSQRTVSVVLSAQVQNYIANMTAAEKRTLDVERAMRTANQTFEKQNQAMTAAGRGMLVAGGVIAVGLGLAVKASAEYGAKLAQLQSLSHASQADMQRLSAAAMTQGTAFGQSATQVAEAEIELVKAGRDASQILGGDLKGALALAAAGQMDVAQATQIGVTAVTQFAKSGATIGHTADLLAAGADKALGSVGELGQALNQGGLVAAQMGLNVDQTVGTLSAFAQAGLLGSDAGTSFKTMLLSLQSPSSQAQKYLDKYNITAYDSKGAFVGITNLAGQLHDKLGDLSQAHRDAALSTIFGTDAIRTANVLYEQGASGIQGWIDKVNVSGFAAVQAAGKMNSLQGDTQKLAAAWETDLVKAGSTADGSLRKVVQTATAVVKAYGDLPDSMQGGIVTAAALTSGVLLLGGAFLIGVPKIAAFRTGLKELNVTGKQAAGYFGKGSAIVLGLTAVSGALAAVNEHGIASTAQLEQAGVRIQSGWKGIDKTFEHVHNGVQDVHGLRAAIGTLGDGVSEASMAKVIDGLTTIGGLNPFPTHFADTYRANEQSLDAIGQQLASLSEKSYPQASAAFASLVKQQHLGADETRTLLQRMPAYREALVGIAEKAHISASEQNLVNLAQGKGAGAAKVLAQATAAARVAAEKQAASLTDLSGSAVSAKLDIGALQQTIEGFGSAQIDARAATRAMYQAVDDASAAVKKNGATLDVHTQKGRDNQAALDALATATDAAASKTLKQTGNVDRATKVMKDGRAEFVKTATAMTGSAREANRLADKLGLIPANIGVAVHATGFDEAKRQADILAGKINNLDGLSAQISVSLVGTGADAAGTVGQIVRNARYASGGQVDGRGPKGVDSVPALLAPNEHVWTSSEVDAVGGQGAMYRVRAAARAGTLQGFAAGGAASDAQRAREEAARRREQMRQQREDFISGQRRGGSDPLGYVDSLRGMSRDSDLWSSSKRHTFDAAANRYESSIVKLTTASEKASQKLNDLRSASDQMRQSIKSSISGGYSASGAGSVMRASGTFTRDGMRFQNYTSGPTAAGLASYYKAGAAETKTFATDLKTLASRGLNGSLLAEIAGYGVAQGAPIAAALLSASASQIRSINSDYSRISKNADTAGKTVADDNYSKQIKAADANADKIEKRLKDEGEKLRHLIAHAFGLKGYASGTGSATPGVHLVGERGPELVGFHGGEWVANAQDTARWVRGGGGGGTARPMRVQVSLPTSMDLVDTGGGLITTVGVIARDVAVQEIAADALNDAVLMAGGAA